MIDAEAIHASLELAADKAGDLTPAVFQRLFARFPEMEAEFVRDTNGSVKGEMLARVFEMVFDYVGEGAYAEGMIRNELVTHDGYGVPPDVFALFFEVVADTVRDLDGEGWTPAMSAAWAKLLADFRRFTDAAAVG